MLTVNGRRLTDGLRDLSERAAVRRSGGVPLIVPVIGCRETYRRDTCRGNANLLPFATRHTEVHSAVVVGLGRRWNIKVR
jgi:hypothetical protein